MDSNHQLMACAITAMSWAEEESVRNQDQPIPKVTTKVSVKCMVRSRCMDSLKYVVDEENL